MSVLLTIMEDVNNYVQTLLEVLAVHVHLDTSYHLEHFALVILI